MTYAVAVAAFVLSVAGTALLRRFALHRELLDIPNERSSHAAPTPRGGGLAVVIVSIVAFVVVWMLGLLEPNILLALLVGGAAVAIIGFIDDWRTLSPSIRLVVHVVASVWALLLLGGLPPLQIGAHTISFEWSGYVLGVLGIVWTLNLFNFMDGIDGIAASEAAFVPCAAAAIGWITGKGSSLDTIGLVFASACCGFLVWNWQPAKIFLGDVGSGYIGYVIAVIAVAAGWENPVSVLVWLILAGAFFVDSTVTFLIRLVRRERVFEAHRTHAYQHLSMRWGSHRRVTMLLIAINTMWLLPCAMLAQTWPDWAAGITVGALAPLVVLAYLARAGRAPIFDKFG